jgi:hypothetical protein
MSFMHKATEMCMQLLLAHSIAKSGLNPADTLSSDGCLIVFLFAGKMKQYS